MIGPGTGLAPFRAFIQELDFKRKLEANKGAKLAPAILFFGCRNPEHDFLYQEELQSYHSSGVIELVVAFSRKLSDKKIYVQDKMREGDMPKKIWELLSNGGCIYVCGDASHMATDVSSALQEIAVTQGKRTAADAKKFFEDLQSKNRYSQDVWS